MSTKQELLRAALKRYLGADKHTKTTILDELAVALLAIGGRCFVALGQRGVGKMRLGPQECLGHVGVVFKGLKISASVKSSRG